jgi:hypothetical protein
LSSDTRKRTIATTSTLPSPRSLPTPPSFDDGKEFHGTDEIRSWLTTAASEWTFTRTLVSAALVDDETWLVVNHLEGNFPGGVVDLRYKFTLIGDLISELVIAP